VQVKARRAAALEEAHVEARRGALVGVQESADLPVDCAGIKPGA